MHPASKTAAVMMVNVPQTAMSQAADRLRRQRRRRAAGEELFDMAGP